MTQPTQNDQITHSNRPLGRNILIWGGGGKSTLSRALAEKLGLPYIEADAIFWLPGWRERDPEDFKGLTLEAMAANRDGWIFDGNYGGVLGGAVLEEADTLIWLDLPFRTIFWRVFKRSVARARDKRLICGENVESWRQTFLSRDSLLLFHIKRRLFGYAASLRRREALISEHGGNATLIRLRSASALNDFYEKHGLVRSDSP